MRQYDRISDIAGLLPGDCIAFSGSGFTSWVIKLFTKSPYSHVAVVIGKKAGKTLIIESTTLKRKDKRRGVVIRNLDEVVSDYPKGIWWFPLSEESRLKFDEESFLTYLIEQEGKPYDFVQAALSATRLDKLLPEIDNHLFCSELVAFGYEHGKLWTKGTVDCSDLNPNELTKLPIFDEPYKITASEL